ncbi:MAG: argininosuccinate lyase [Armatimonadetes bacterium]|nr:argininosuccinate lyase [Armatimonadota bacterium]
MKKPWSGRFAKETDKSVEEFTASVHYDLRLFEHDVRGSIAHARMLGKQGIIPAEDAAKIVQGLESLLEDWRAGRIEFDPKAEDVHMNVEKLLAAKIGEPAGRLHTARSRNDQVATDVRMWLKDEIDFLSQLMAEFQHTLVSRAAEHLDTIMPGYTHLQHAQPVLLAHHLLAYFWMIERDKKRLADCRKRVDVLPLGSGALAGTDFPIDREFVAKEIGFSRISENSLDAVSDRDFVTEFLAAAAITMTHLSRFAEELVLWSSREFGFVELDDSVTTGSSIMPQKKNPDAAELTRGKTGRVFGDLVALLTLQKGLPLSYNRDLQEDKEPLFDAVDTLRGALSVFIPMVATAKFKKGRMREALEGDFSTATDLADYLVKTGVPFRQAHEIVGKLVAECISTGRGLEDLSLDDLRKALPQATEDVLRILQPEESVAARSTPGGTARSAVEKQIEAARALIKEKG